MNKLIFLLAFFLLIFSLSTILPKTAHATTFIVPNSLITNVQNITLQNTQSSAITAGTQIRIPFNAIASNAYLNGAGDNWVIFNGFTGNILYSWEEGNVLNPLQTSSMNTVNTLSFWVVLPSQIAASTTAVNVLSIGFMPMADISLNGNNIGTAGYISNSIAGGTCTNYDNGGNVFTSYTSFCGLSAYPVTSDVKLAWSNGAGTLGINSNTVFGTTNIIFWSTSGADNGIELANSHLPSSYNTPGYDTDLLTSMQGSLNQYSIQLGSTFTTGIGQSRYELQGRPGLSNPYGFLSGAYARNLLTPNAMLQVPVIISTDYLTPTTMNVYTNYSLETAIPPSTATNPLTISTAQGNTIYGLATATIAARYSVWFSRTRIMLPGDTTPIISFGPAQAVSPYTPPSTPSLTLSNTLIDQGQSILFTSSFTIGSASSYTYNLNIVNSITPSVIIANFLTTNSYASNTYFWTPPDALYTANTFEANLIISDGTTTINTVYTPFGYNSILVAGTPTESNSIIDAGQPTLQTSQASGGTSPYTAYQWYSNYGIVATCSGSGNALAGATGTTYLAFPTTSNAYAYSVTDSASMSPVTMCSPSNSETTNGALAVSISPLTNIITIGQSQTWTATVTPGQGPYTYNWQVFNSLGLVFNNLIVGNAFTQNQFTILPQVPGTYYVNVIITDSATTNEIANSVNSVLIVSSPPANTIFCNSGVPTNMLSGIVAQNINSSTLILYALATGTFTGNVAGTNPPLQTLINSNGLLFVMSNKYTQFNWNIGSVTMSFSCQWLANSGGGSFPVSYNTLSPNNINNNQFSISTGFMILMIAIFTLLVAIMLIMFIPFLTEKMRRRKGA